MGNCLRPSLHDGEESGLLVNHAESSDYISSSSSDEAPLFLRAILSSQRRFRNRRRRSTRTAESQDSSTSTQRRRNDSTLSQQPPHLSEQNQILLAQRLGLIQHLPLTIWKNKHISSGNKTSDVSLSMRTHDTSTTSAERSTTPPPPCYQKTEYIPLSQCQSSPVSPSHVKTDLQNNAIRTEAAGTVNGDPIASNCQEQSGVNEKSDENECTICMEEFLTGESIRYLPCMHFYHQACIDDWLMRSFTCPRCMDCVDVGIMASFAEILS